MAVAPLIWMAGSAIASYYAGKKGAKKGAAQAQPPAGSTTMPQTEQPVGVPTPPASAASTQSANASQAWQAAMKRRRKAAAGTTGSSPMTGGGLGGSMSGRIQTVIGS